MIKQNTVSSKYLAWGLISPTDWPIYSLQSYFANLVGFKQAIVQHKLQHRRKLSMVIPPLDGRPLVASRSFLIIRPFPSQVYQNSQTSIRLAHYSV